MKLFKYNQFLDVKPINENVAKAKSYLKEFYLTEKAARELGFITEDMDYERKEGQRRVFLMKDFTPEQQQQIRNKIKGRGEFEGKGLKVSDEEIRKIEQSEEFKKVRETKYEIKDASGKVVKTYQLDRDHAGYVSHFTYFYYAENQSYEQLASLYERLIDYKDLLDKMPKKFDAAFIDETIPNPDHPHTNAEDLSDALDDLKGWRQLSKLKQTLPTHLRRAIDTAPELQIKDLMDIARSFDEFEPAEKRDLVWKGFFGDMQEDRQPTLPDGKPNPNFGKVRYMSRLGLIKTLPDLIKSAKGHLAGSASSGYTDRIDKINKTNDKFGVKGATVVYNENGIMVVKVHSYAANNFLNSHCSHCIVDRGDQYWTSYVGDLNMQYYVYNFNIPNTDPIWTIGVTIKPDRTWSSGACQNARNSYVGGEFRTILKKWEKEYNLEVDLLNDVLNPMSKEEMNKIQRAKLAEREIVKKGISIEQIKVYVTEDGADINKDGARALLNAIEEDDFEKVKLCLELGASPNLKKGTEAGIAKAKSLDVIKLLVSYGAEMQGDVFNNVLDDMAALDYCLKAGLDPNFNSSMPFRKVTRGSWRDRENIGSSYFEAFKLLLKHGGKMTDDRGRNVIIKWAAEYGRLDILRYLDEIGVSKTFRKEDWKEALAWISHSRKTDDDTKNKVSEFLQSKIDE